MKKFILACFLLLISFFVVNEAYAIVSVKGYYRSNGTYVAPHYRSDPDGIKSNNFSYPGNYNPNTGNITGGTPSYSSPSYSPPSYNYPSYSVPTTPSCPPLSSYDSLSGSCQCWPGYVVGADYLGKQACVSGDSKCTTDYGYGAKYNSSSKKCECGYGYVMSASKCVSEFSYCSDTIGMGLMSRYDSLSGKCECMSGYEYNGSRCTIKSTSYYGVNNGASSGSCPSNSHESLSDSTKCTCDTGYGPNSSKDGCIFISCQENATLSGGKCTCLDGYIMQDAQCITHTDNCKISFGNNVYGTKNVNGDINNSSCYCNTGFEWNIEKTSCMQKEATCPEKANKLNGICYCNAGYYFNSDKTACLKETLKVSYATTPKMINLREKASISSRIIGTTKKDAKYEIVDQTNKDWIKIKLGNKTGWVSKNLIKITN